MLVMADLQSTGKVKINKEYNLQMNKTIRFWNQSGTRLKFTKDKKGFIIKKNNIQITSKTIS